MLRLTLSAVFVSSCLPVGLGFEAGEHPLSDQERYLEAYLDELADYRDNPVARRYVALANLVDVVPTWIEDLFIPLFIPGSTLTIPIDMVIPISVDLGPVEIPLPASFTLFNITLNDLNEFKKLRPLKLRSDSKFTWDGTIELKQTTAIANAQLKVLGHDIDVSVNLPLTNPSIKFSSIIAFNRTRLCDVWGSTMRSSLHCSIWPLANHEEHGVSGVNITAFELAVDDFDFSISLSGLGVLDQVLVEELTKALNHAKPSIIANLPGSSSQALRAKANDAFLHGLPRKQREAPCTEVVPESAINASRVCFSTNGGYALKWLYHDCPAHFVSRETPSFPIDQSWCMDLIEEFPAAEEGQVLRVAAQAVAGIHEILDPSLRYVPNSNVAGFECSGTTLHYSCQLISLAPVNPSALAQVSEVCIVNHAGFVMYFEEQNQRTQNWTGWSGKYPVNQRKCIDLSSTDAASEGDVFKTRVKAVWGKRHFVNRDVEYRNNGMSASFECRGTTLNYHCNLLGLAAPEPNLLV